MSYIDKGTQNVEYESQTSRLVGLIYTVHSSIRIFLEYLEGYLKATMINMHDNMI